MKIFSFLGVFFLISHKDSGLEKIVMGIAQMEEKEIVAL